MDSKRNKMLMETSREHQRFSIRKLTVGAASVLLGTMLFWGTNATVHAADNDTASTSTISKNQEDVINEKVATPDSSIAQNDSQKENEASVSNEQDNKAEQTLKIKKDQEVDASALASTLSENKTEVKKPQFTGTTQFNPSKKEYKDGDTQYINYRLSTYGDTNVEDAHFLLLIPKGFKAGTLNWNNTTYKQQTQDLGNVGPNGEQTFIVTTKGNPSWPGVWVNTTMTADAKNGGGITYSRDNPLVYELASDATAGWGNATLNLKNNSTYQVVKSAYWESNGDASYSVMPGKRALPSSDFEISHEENGEQIAGPKISAHNGENNTEKGYEELVARLTPNIGHIEDGDYIDFKLGLTDSSGNLHLYNNTLAPGRDLTITPHNETYTIGHIYNMGTYYRIVFNSSINNFPNYYADLDLKWASGDRNSAINPDQSDDTKLGQVFVYKYAPDESLVDHKFAFIPSDDVQINDKKYNSGLKIQGNYISKTPMYWGNPWQAAGGGYSTNRTWGTDNSVAISNHWENTFSVQVATHGVDPTKDASNNFSVQVSVGKSDQFNYHWASDDDIKNAIIGNPNDPNSGLFAKKITHTLKNNVANNSDVYFEDHSEAIERPTSAVTVTHEDLTNDPTRYVRIYHIKIADPSIRLWGSFTPLSVSSDNFTMPNDIHSYQEDIDAANRTKGGNYNTEAEHSAETSNKDLENALKNTPIVLISVNNDTTNKNVLFPSGGNWAAGIATQTNGTNLGYWPGNFVTSNIKFIDDTDPNNYVQVGPAGGISAQGPTDHDIRFNGATTAMTNLINSGYKLDKVVAILNGKENPITTTDSNLNDIEKYNFGSFGKIHNIGDNFIVYVNKKNSNPSPSHETESHTKQVTETIKYVFEDENGNKVDSPSRKSDSQSLSFTGERTKGSSENYTYPNESKEFASLPISSEPGFKIISATRDDNGKNVLDNNSIASISGIKHDSNSITITVIFQKLPSTKPEKQDVQTTVHYIDVSNSNKQKDFQPTDGIDLNKNIIEKGKDGDNFPAKLWNYTNDGWTLIAQDPEVSNGKLTKDMKSDLYVYLKKTVTKPQTSTPQGSIPQASTPQPSSPQPSEPQASKPQTSKPEKPTPETPKKPHVPSTKKHHNHKKTSKKHWNENYGVHGQYVNGRKNHWSNTYRPHAQDENVGPHANVSANSKSSSRDATLPQTGEKQNNLGLIGLAFASIAGLFGFAADRKRKN